MYRVSTGAYTVSRKQPCAHTLKSRQRLSPNPAIVIPLCFAMVAVVHGRVLNVIGICRRTRCGKQKKKGTCQTFCQGFVR